MMSSRVPGAGTLLRGADRGARAVVSLVSVPPKMLALFDNTGAVVSRVNEAMPQVVRAFDQVEALTTSLNDAVPQMMRAFDQVEALTTSLNDTMPQVTPLLDEAGTFVQNLNTTMPRVGPTLDQLVAMAGNMNTALVQIGYLLDRTNSLLETADALIEGIESTYQDGVLGSTGRVVTKARSASRDLLDKGPSFLRAQDDFQAGW